MPRTKWERIDRRVVIWQGDEPEAKITVELPDNGRTSRFDLADAPLSFASIVSLLDRVPSRPATGMGELLFRLALDIQSPELHALPWDSWIRPRAIASGFNAVVRVSRVVPRVAQIAFTLPLRILLVDRGDADQVREDIRSLFGHRSEEEIAEALVVRAVAAKALKENEIPEAWPVVDVVHFAQLPFPHDDEAQLSPSLKRGYGTLGWWSRQLDAWQTRLLILDGSTDSELALARRFGAALVARGGPAVIVRHAASPIRELYDGVVHDAPLDGLKWRTPIDCLFGGAGREELARVSNAGQVLVDLATEWRTEVRRGGEDKLRYEVSVFAQTFEGYHFDKYERDGLLPMATALRTVRDARPSVLSEDISGVKEPRYVNGSLWTEKDAHRVDAQIETLILYDPYQLRVQIGALDREIPVYGTAVFEEIPKVKPDQQGVWIEVAVNGVGFEVEGDRVQLLWVPYDAPSDVVQFAVRPMIRGAAMLRFTLYHRQNVLQTFRIAAIVRKDQRLFLSGPESHALADALGIPYEEVAPDTTWLSRLEYAAVPISAADRQPDRDIAIVANQVAGRKVITVKGDEFFVDTDAGDIAPLVASVRDALFDCSLDRSLPKREDWIYRFGKIAAQNTVAFEEALPVIARAGWLLYERVLAFKHRKEVEKTLEGEAKKIGVAHTLLDEVIPWAAVYDRMFKVPDGGVPQVCLAALPGSDGKLPATDCGTLDGCPLKTGADPKHVACPLRFWGFRHVIEVPPKQASEAPPDDQSVSASPHQLQLAVVVNAAISSVESHVTRLKELKRHGIGVSWKYVESDPSRVVKVLEDRELDVIYLYCHARGGIADPATRPPCVEFSDKKKTVQITSDEFDFEPWERKPLVIVNGCSTAAFSPDALSPFVRKFTRDREAGGVLGTEIPVHEVLAGEVAVLFLQRFLEGEQAGPALLAVRRSLLAEKNPLGLAYTLYAMAELSIS